MRAVVHIDAAPGFEDSVEAALSGTDGVFRVVNEKAGNFDLAAGIQAPDANGIQDLENEIRHESGVQGLQRLDSPGQQLLDRLTPESIAPPGGLRVHTMARTLDTRLAARLASRFGVSAR